MTRDDLIERIAQAIATMEGFYRPGTLARRNANPGNIRRWSSASGDRYPTHNGYVSFTNWAFKQNPNLSNLELIAAAETEGWRVLKTLIGQYIDGKYHHGEPPTFYAMFEVYAPARDRNKPRAYAEFVARRCNAKPGDRIKELIDE